MRSGDFDLDQAIRKVPDFPKAGILFYDLTSILTDPPAFNYCIEALAESCRALGPAALVGVEARGFLFAAPVAARLGLPLLLVRKKGKLPGRRASKSFALEYGTDTIEVHADDAARFPTAVLIDDLVATGGTLEAACELLAEQGCRVKGISCVVGLPFLKYAEKLDPIRVKTLIDYRSE
jgi:adenine phosphoribosyltransferase